MPKSNLELSTHQYQTLVDIGIDAWYLTPLTRANTDSSFQASQENIADIVEGLTAQITQPSKPIEKVSHQNSSDPTLHDNSSITKDSKHSNTSVDDIQNSFKNNLAEVVSSVANNVSLSSQNKSPSIITGSSPVVLNPLLDLRPPDDTLINFPSISKTVAPTLPSIKTAINTLQDNNVGVDSNKVIMGQGRQTANMMVIIPPPTLQHIESQNILNSKEKQLFNEVMRSIQKTTENIYITPLIKQSVLKKRDPDKDLLENQLPILAAEITLIRPEHIIVMGRVPNHVLLSTKAPLKELMTSKYQLSLDNNTYPLSVLPSFDYFLALPAEKHRLWHSLKSIR